LEPPHEELHAAHDYAPPHDVPRDPREHRVPRERLDPSLTAGLHVLFVDDEPSNRRLGARMLDRIGCSHEEAEDGSEVLPRLREHAARGTPFDVLLLDILMRDVSGVEACAEARAAGFGAVLAVALTGSVGPRDVLRYMQAGFDLVLPKPFDVRAMQRAILDGRALRAHAHAHAHAHARTHAHAHTRSHAPSRAHAPRPAPLPAPLDDEAPPSHTSPSAAAPSSTTSPKAVAAERIAAQQRARAATSPRGPGAHTAAAASPRTSPRMGR
jgi:CheY-like chemotaxis protein